MQLVKLERKNDKFTDEELQALIEDMKKADGFICVLKNKLPGYLSEYVSRWSNMTSESIVYAAQCITNNVMSDDEL